MFLVVYLRNSSGCDFKGPHRTSEAYSSRIRRHLQWFADRSPLLAERLYNYQEENKIEPSYDLVEPSDSDTPPRCVFNAAERARLGDEPKVTKFTREDWDSFIRFAAARPSGMEPTGLEKAADVWELLAKTVSFLNLHIFHDDLFNRFAR